ncbi:MAG: hypothetical protein ACLGI7_16190 [Gammaproteobacteria bacterium]
MLEWAIIAGVAVLVLFGSVGSLRRIKTRLRDELARVDPGGAGLRRDMSLIEQVKALAQHAQRAAATVDPTSFGDPLAARVEWKPASPGGTNIRTRKLVEAAPGRLELRPSAGILVFGGVFLLVGLGVMAIGVVPMWTRGFELSPEQLMPGLMGLVFASVGAALIYFSARPVVFDRASGRFWIGREPPPTIGAASGPKSGRLLDVHALQLLAEHVRGNKSSYWSYELNLVLRDGTRINVTDHGDLQQLRADAQRLAATFGWKVWDAASR